MDFRQNALIGIAALFVGVMGIVAARLDVLWIYVPVIASLFAGCATAFFFHIRQNSRDILALNDMVEGTRQHVTLLARHTREFHDLVSQSSPDWPMQTSKNAPFAPAEDFSTLSTLVSDLADALTELDQRFEALEVAQSLNAGGDEKPHSLQMENRGQGVKSKAPDYRDHGRVTFAQTYTASREDQDFFYEDAPLAKRNEREIRSVASQPAPMREPSRMLRQLVAAAIAADKFDLYLQRIVGLPQRKIRGYEVMLRPEGADVTLDNSAIREAIEAVGHQLMFDRRMVVQAIRLARVFDKRGRDVRLFVELSQRFLMSRDALDEVAALLIETPNASRRITIAFPARLFQKPAAFERECLRELASLGFSFMARDLELHEINIAALSNGAVRWGRISAQQFLEFAQTEDSINGVGATDLAALLERNNVSLLIDRVQDEPIIAELLDLGVEYAQGLIFAAPQMVQAESFDLLLPANASTTPHAATQTQKLTEPDRRGLRDIARRTNV